MSGFHVRLPDPCELKDPNRRFDGIPEHATPTYSIGTTC